jgi:hypothetical protein
VLLSRRGELITLALPLAEEAPESWTLEVRPDATPQQKTNLDALIAPSR